MGNWHISIEGIGAHNNNQEFDADYIAKECVKTLKRKGHNVTHASFTQGGAESLDIEDKKE